MELIPSFSATRDKDTLALENRLEYPVFAIWQAKRRLELLREAQAQSRDPLAQMASDEESSNLASAIDELESVLEDARNQVGKNGIPDYIETLRIQDWAKVIPVREIETASIYDPDAHRAWFVNEEINAEG